MTAFEATVLVITAIAIGLVLKSRFEGGEEDFWERVEK